MARILIVGCGCRGRALAGRLAERGHAVRGTTRDAARAAEISEAGAEVAVADPDHLGTVMRALEGVSVVCWLMGTAADGPQLHGDRLRTLMERLVDTPVRGLVYEAAGTVDRRVLAEGAGIVRRAGETWRIPVELVGQDPRSIEGWLSSMSGAVDRLLAPAPGR